MSASVARRPRPDVRGWAAMAERESVTRAEAISLFWIGLTVRSYLHPNYSDGRLTGTAQIVISPGWLLFCSKNL